MRGACHYERMAIGDWVDAPGSTGGSHSGVSMMLVTHVGDKYMTAAVAKQLNVQLFAEPCKFGAFSWDAMLLRKAFSQL